MEAREILLNEIKEKRHMIDDLRTRIQECSEYCNHFTDMKMQISRVKDSGDVDPGTLEEYQKLENAISQQKLQLQSDVHFIIEKELQFIHQASNVVSA